jgi:hypothetical protein
VAVRGAAAGGVGGALVAAKRGMEFFTLRYRPQLKGRATTRNARNTESGEDFFMILGL